MHHVIALSGGKDSTAMALRLAEWYDLWRDHNEVYAAARELEQRYSHTFRSEQRDTWPAALVDLEMMFCVHLPRGATNQLSLFDDEEDNEGACRVCRM